MAISARVNSDPIRFKDPPPPEKKCDYIKKVNI